MNNLVRRAGADITEPLRRFFKGDLDNWLRTEEYREGQTLVIKAEVPGIGPNKDVDITMLGDQLRINVTREENRNTRARKATAPSSATAPFPGPCHCPRAPIRMM